MAPFVGLIISYLAGSIPSAYIAGRLRGVDLRKHGSGNLGATNVVRVLGAKTGAVVFIADLLKGFLPVHFLPIYTGTLPHGWWALAFGAAAILGHIKPVFLLGKGGGKGMATATGVFLALAFIPMIVAEVVWIATFYFTRYVSLASLLGAAVFPFALLAWYRDPRSPIFIASVIIAVFMF